MIDQWELDLFWGDLVLRRTEGTVKQLCIQMFVLGNHWLILAEIVATAMAAVLEAEVEMHHKVTLLVLRPY
jgi:hypothetical protein